MNTELKKTADNRDPSFEPNDAENMAELPNEMAEEQPDEQLDPEKAMELEMLMEEYETDRDAILLTIQNALKDQDYDEAQAFVYKYRAAAKHDENFKLLARMTAQGLEGAKKIKNIETVLEATAEDDYEIRIALYERILKIQPDNAKYKKALEECRSLAGLNEPNADKSSVKKLTNKQKALIAAGVLILLACIAAILIQPMIVAGVIVVLVILGVMVMFDGF